MIFEFLNKDTVLATLEICENGVCLLDTKDNIPGCIEDMPGWIIRRTSPVCRENINNILKAANIKHTEEYLRVTRALSLTDTMWFRPVGEPVTWADVSPYKNDINVDIADMALGKSIDGQNLRVASPQYTLDGSADKCWKRGDKNTCMIKTTGEKYNGISGNRAYCEYYASQVADAFMPYKSHLLNIESLWNKIAMILIRHMQYVITLQMKIHG